jgi:hypothetical protein
MRHDAASALSADEEIPSLDSVRDAREGRRFERRPRSAASGDVALKERPAAEPRRRPPAPRSAPGRAYGSHRRGEGTVATGHQPGRRTVEIRGQAQAPRRRSQTTAAFVARPDRTALWAFLLALFLVLVAVATANPGV